tara:strand:+ start:1243 stop:1773 length:531 start_codon:yes stop_codon:yes gene_type:complete
MKFKKFKFKKVNSTNYTAIDFIKKRNLGSGMIVSESQKRGRGQYGKKWISLKGNLFVSFFYELNNLTVSLKELTKINCLLVKKILSLYYKKKITYKKPNDLLIDKKKICGILQETIKKTEKVYLIVGIGINLAKHPNINNYPSTSLYDLIGRKVSVREIENKLKKIFELKLTKLEK